METDDALRSLLAELNEAEDLIGHLRVRAKTLNIEVRLRDEQLVLLKEQNTQLEAAVVSLTQQLASMDDPTPDKADHTS